MAENHMHRQDEPEIDMEQVLANLRSGFSRMRLGGGGSRLAFFIFAIFGVSLLIWLAIFSPVWIVGGLAVVMGVRRYRRRK